MRKYCLLLLFTLLSIVSYAQHMTFMGIPINGNIDTFTAKLKGKGLKISKMNSSIGAGLRAFCGKYYGGYREPILVAYSPKSKTVFSVMVVFDGEFYYEDLKGNLSKKYIISSDGEDGAIYETDFGKVALIRPTDEGNVMLIFTDAANNEKADEERTSDL